MIRASELLFAGVDGCVGGWAVVTGGHNGEDLGIAVVSDFAAVLRLCSDAQAIAVDMPIGLPEDVIVGGREADRLARKMLSPRRGASVFSSPGRKVVVAKSYAEATLLSHQSSTVKPLGLSKQCFNLFGKIREIDELIQPADQDRIFESHPELAFSSLNHGHAMPNPKRTLPGTEERRIALASVGFDTLKFLEGRVPRRLAQIDDILDATVLCWLAGRIHRQEANRVPANPPTDSHGLRMEIWY